MSIFLVYTNYAGNKGEESIKNVAEAKKQVKEFKKNWSPKDDEVVLRKPTKKWEKLSIYVDGREVKKDNNLTKDFTSRMYKDAINTAYKHENIKKKKRYLENPENYLLFIEGNTYEDSELLEHAGNIYAVNIKTGEIEFFFPDINPELLKSSDLKKLRDKLN